MDITRVRLLQALEQSGIWPEDVGTAIASGEFSFAFVDALFPEQNTAALSDLDFEDMCRQFGFPFEFLQDVYAGLGLPQPTLHHQVRQDDLDMAPVLQAIRGLPVSGTEGAIAHAARFWGEKLRSLTRAELNFFETYVMNPLLRSGLPEQQMLEIALPQGRMAQELDEQVLVWLHRRHIEQGMIEAVLDHVEAAIERTGAIRRPPRQVPAIAFLGLSGFTALTEERGDEAAVELTVKALRPGSLGHRSPRGPGGEVPGRRRDVPFRRTNGGRSSGARDGSGSAEGWPPARQSGSARRSGYREGQRLLRTDGQHRLPRGGSRASRSGRGDRGCLHTM